MFVLATLGACGRRESDISDTDPVRTLPGEEQGPVLRLTIQRGEHDFSVCNLSASRKRTSSLVGGSGSSVAESCHLISIETNGFRILFRRLETDGTATVSNGFSCFFPYGSITITQGFDSAHIKGEFRK